MCASNIRLITLNSVFVASFYENSATAISCFVAVRHNVLGEGYAVISLLSLNVHAIQNATMTYWIDG